MARSDEYSQPMGAGHASAMFRLGLAEIRAASTFSESNITQPSPYGIYGVATPQEVLADKQGEVREQDEQPSILGDRLEQAERQAVEREPERDERAVERD